MYKLFHFDGIDLYNDNGNFLFITRRGNKCLYDVKKDIYVYDDTIRYDKIYIECFIEDNWNTIEEWRNWQGDYHDFPYKFIETL